MFNRTEIMKNAWHKIRRFGMNRATALRLAWYEAKQAIQRYNVWGERLNGTVELLAKGVSSEAAYNVQHLQAGRYDVITIKAA